VDCVLDTVTPGERWWTMRRLIRVINQFHATPFVPRLA